MFNKFDNIGKIVIVKNISFKDTKDGILQADHAALSGRPCIIISDSLDKMYLLPSTSNQKKRKYIEEYFELTEENFNYTFLKTNPSFIKLSRIIEKEIFFGQDYGEISPTSYYELLKSFIKCQEKHKNNELYDLIKNDINDQVINLEKRLALKK